MRQPSSFPPWRRPCRQRPTGYESSFHCSGPSLSSFPSSNSFFFSSTLSCRSYRHMSSTLHVVTASFPYCFFFHKPFVYTPGVPPYSVNTKTCTAAGTLFCRRSPSSSVRACRHLTTINTSTFASSGAFTAHPDCKTASSAHHQSRNMTRSSSPFLLSPVTHMRHSFFSSVISCPKTHRDLEPSTTRGCIGHTQRQPLSSLQTSCIFSPSSVNTRDASAWPSSLSRRSSRFSTLPTASPLPSSKVGRSRTLCSSLFASLSQVSSTTSAASLFPVSGVLSADSSSRFLSSLSSSFSASSCVLCRPSSSLRFSFPSSLLLSDSVHLATQSYRTPEALATKERRKGVLTKSCGGFFNERGEARECCWVSQHRRMSRLSYSSEPSKQEHVEGEAARAFHVEEKSACSETSEEEGRENKAHMRRKGTACTQDREHGLATQQHGCTSGENRDSSPVEVSVSSASEPSSVLAASSSPPPMVSSSSVPAEKEGQRTLPACVQDTYIDLG